MICNHCDNLACELRERCELLYNDIAGCKIEDIITLEIKCKDFRPLPDKFSVLSSYQMP